MFLNYALSSILFILLFNYSTLAIKKVKNYQVCKLLFMPYCQRLIEFISLGQSKYETLSIK